MCSQVDQKEVVKITFSERLYVTAKTDKAIGLTSTDKSDAKIELWLPLSQMSGESPEKGDWIESVCLPRWLAKEKKLPA